MAAMRHRHYGSHAIAACLVLGMVVRPMTFLGAVYNPLIGLLSTVVFAAVVVAYRHYHGPLCEQCVAAMPLDPQARADRVKALLRFAHAVADGGYLRRIVYGILASLYVLAAWVPVLLDVPFAVEVTTYEVFTLYVLVMYVSIYLHNRFQLWCPYCRHGGGDDRKHNAPPAVPQPA